MLLKERLKISGMHCASCKILIKSELESLKGVKKVFVEYPSGECLVEFDDAFVSRKNILRAIEKLNYKVKEDEDNGVAGPAQEDGLEIKITLSEKSIIAVFLVALFFAGYFLVKKFGGFEILSRLNEKNLSYGLIFLIGFLASFHCVGMCGGIVVSYTARNLKQESFLKIRHFVSHFLYNLGRVTSYSLIGGILGGFGSFFGINPTFTGIITLLAGGFMIAMGLSLLTNFKWLEKIKLRTPSFVAKFLYGQRHARKPKGPFVIGFLNGFMPCGPLQAMQLYALASGSFTRGAFSMAVYALGTIPLMFGLGSFISLVSQEKVKQIIKFSGVIVIVLGLFMFNRGLANFGYRVKFLPSISKEQRSKAEYEIVGEVKEYQTAKMALTFRGYVPNVLYVKKGIPVRWIIDVKEMSGCTDTILIEKFNIRKELQYGENVIEFLPTEAGEIKFSCWMGMVWGKFVVTDSGERLSGVDTPVREELEPLPQGGGCSADGGGCGGCGRSRIR